VPTSRMTEMENWKTTSDERSQVPLRLVANDPLSTSAGRKADNTNAGYRPAARPVAMATVTTRPISHGVKVRVESVTDEKAGSRMTTSRNARTIAIRDSTRDSPRNWRINWPRSEPRVLRTPTSRARPVARAVDRFMKLMHAMTSTNRAITPRM